MFRYVCSKLGFGTGAEQPFRVTTYAVVIAMLWVGSVWLVEYFKERDCEQRVLQARSARDYQVRWLLACDRCQQKHGKLIYPEIEKEYELLKSLPLDELDRLRYESEDDDAEDNQTD